MHRPNTRKRKRQHKKNESDNGVVTIGLLYADWCKHCKTLKPEWKKMKYIIQKTPSYKKGLYKFDEINDADRFKINKINKINKHLVGDKLPAMVGYPTIFKVKNNKLTFFTEGRDANSLQNWFLETNTEDPPPPPRGVYSVINRIFGGKTRKNRKKLK